MEVGRPALLGDTSVRIASAIVERYGAVYSTAGYDHDRQMRVIKMRGFDHESHPYRLSLGPVDSRSRN